jgi:hypothetical protein
MAGTLFGLPLSQRVDLNGIPSVGWKLYVYQANTSTPVNTYQDAALTVLNSWPVVADSYGMMGQIWVADGSYRARATNADASLIYFDMPSVLAIGASTGTAPSGGVDPNAIFNTGDVMFQEVNATRAGWVRDNGRTIGSAISGATERANADCQNLFTFYWNGFPDAKCPVSGGRGANAGSDWSVNKTIQTIDKRGISPIGLDSMGNTVGNKFGGVPFADGDKDTPGSICGENNHQLVIAELPVHDHPCSVAEPPHTHTGNLSNAALLKQGGASFQLGAGGGSADTVTVNINQTTTGVAVFVGNRGGDGFHNIVQRSIVGTWFRKL